MVKRGNILDRNGAILARDANEEDAFYGNGRRVYPIGVAAAHVVGYFDPRYGMAGVEKAADAELTGVEETALDALTRRGRDIVGDAFMEGRDVRLSIDARLQRAAWKAMEGKRGAVVALNPETGEILAMVSSPAFDPTEPGGYYGDAEAAPFLNRVIQGKYPAGSTFKVVMALMAADGGIAPVLNCPAEGYQAAKDGKAIRDSEYYLYQRSGRTWRGFGKIGLGEALVHSSNVYFAQLAQKIPVERFNECVVRLGINTPRVLFSMEQGDVTASAGSIQSVRAEDKKMRAQLAIGQGTMLVSPLDVACWTAVVANGGVLNSPHLERDAPKGKYGAIRITAKRAAEHVRGMMRDVVRRGTGHLANIPRMGVSGKTGTAQNPKGDDHSWFTCFTAETNPKMVLTVLVENGGFGSKNALPIARQILESALAFGILSTFTSEEVRGK